MDATVGIIGAGPAGISTAVQARRYGIDTIVFERDAIGGLVRNAYLVENSMFFPDGIKGVDICGILEEYVRRYDIEVRFEEVMTIEVDDRIRLKTPRSEYEFKYVVVATGTVPRKLPFQNVKYHITELSGRYGRIAIIGGGEVALDYSLSASEIADKVLVLHRSELKANNNLKEYVYERNNIELIKTEVRDILHRDGLFLIDTSGGVIEADAVLVAIGREPEDGLIRGIDDDRIYRAGDVKNGILRQMAIAVGDGIKVAMDIWRRERYGDTQ